MASCASPISHQPYLSEHHLSPFPMPSFASPNSRSAFSDLLHINEAISLHSSPISLSIQKKNAAAGSPPQKNQLARKTTEATDTAPPRVILVPHGDDDWKENIREYGGAAQPGNSACLQATPSSMKRKRPAKLVIPEFARLASFGKAKEFEHPQPAESWLEPQGYETETFGVYCRKGRKECMEDTHTAVTEFRGKPGQALFAVFDGHGGRHAATFAADNFAKYVSMALDQKSVDAMQASYLALDSEFLSKNTSSGACSVSALLTDGLLTVANAGDCKAVLCRNGKAEALNTLHRASNAQERQRIESLGGYVDCFNGVWRVQGTLAVTRAFGDLNLKQWVSAEPEVTHMVLSKDCEFLILATDGLWDAMGDQEAVDCVREALNVRLEPETPRTPLLAKMMQHEGSYRIDTEHSNGVLSCSSKMEACKKLVHTACSRGNLDDITVVIVILQGFSKPAA